MSVCTHMLQLLVLVMSIAKCFAWDIIVTQDKQLQFYNHGTLTHIEDIPLAEKIYSIIYDPVHYRVLFVDRQTDHINLISSFDLSTRNIQPLITRQSSHDLRVAYDPVTELLFLIEGWGSIYSYLLNPESTNKAVHGYNIVNMMDRYIYDIAVDSCGGYIYWITDIEIERARFDGSDREVLIHSTAWYRYSLAIDQQTQKMYWTEKMHNDDKQVSIESADLNGKHRKTLYTIKNETEAGSMTVSNNFIYWNGINQKAILQLPKDRNLEAKLFATSYNVDWIFQVIAANYTIKDQLKGNKNCETLKSLIPNKSEPDCLYCVHGTKVSGESRCECTKGYTGGRCDISVCQNYCLQGNCSVSAEGQPKCSCEAGYSGQRCEVNACHGYCLNSGVCSLNEEHHPVCQCTAGYDGERCDVPAVVIKFIQTVLMLRDILSADIPPITHSKGVQSTCASTAV